MNLKFVAAAAVCSLTAVVPASAQTVYTTDTAYIEPAPTYVVPSAPTYFPGDIVPVQPQVTVVEPSVVAPAPYAVRTAPRYEYNRGYYGVAYAPSLSCTVDMFGNRICD